MNHPGQPVRFVGKLESRLTERQGLILHTVRAFNGNRSRAARHLGVSVGAVQKSLGYAKQAGVNVPPGRVGRRGIPDRDPRLLGPRCGKPMRSGMCGRRLDHPACCIEQGAWQRYRGPGISLFPR